MSLNKPPPVRSRRYLLWCSMCLSKILVQRTFIVLTSGSSPAQREIIWQYWRRSCWNMGSQGILDARWHSSRHLPRITHAPFLQELQVAIKYNFSSSTKHTSPHRRVCLTKDLNSTRKLLKRTRSDPDEQKYCQRIFKVYNNLSEL